MIRQTDKFIALSILISLASCGGSETQVEESTDSQSKTQDVSAPVEMQTIGVNNPDKIQPIPDTTPDSVDLPEITQAADIDQSNTVISEIGLEAPGIIVTTSPSLTTIPINEAANITSDSARPNPRNELDVSDLNPYERLCLTNSVFGITGTYKGVLTQKQTDMIARTSPSTSMCAYDVTVTFNQPSYLESELSYCVQLATYTAIGTQHISGDYDCFSVESETMSLFWEMDDQFTGSGGTLSVREEIVYPVTAHTNSLAMHNLIQTPLRNESGLRFVSPPGQTRLYLDEHLNFSRFDYYDGSLTKLEL